MLLSDETKKNKDELRSETFEDIRRFWNSESGKYINSVQDKEFGRAVIDLDLVEFDEESEVSK